MKKTKRSLLMSVVSLLLCFSMLLGSTFAWFTDSVTSGSNVIQSGNLDLDVQYTLDGENWKNLDGANDLFQKGLWEPGHTEVVALRIENKGSLALKYQANMNIIKETIGKNKDGGDIVLSDILTVSTLTQQANQIGDIAVMLAFTGENAVDYTDPVAFKSGNVLQNDSNLLPGEAHYVIVKVDMAETVGNEANHDGVNKPSIEFGINVLATQTSNESDSFGSDYDKNATFDDFANTNILATETKTLVAGENSVEFDLSNEGLKIANVSVPADAILDPTKPVTVTFDGIELQITGENIVGYAYDIKVTNLKSGLTGDQLVTVVVEAPNALAAMQAYHNGVLIEDAVYDEVAGTITFKTASFSPFDFTANVTPVYNLKDLRTVLNTDGANAKLMAKIEVDLTKDTGAARDINHAYVGTNNTYYNGVMINGKNVGLDLNGHSITAFCGNDHIGNSDVGALFFVGKDGSLNITDTGDGGFIKMASSIYAVWAPFADPSYVDIYGGAFIGDSYAGDPIGTPVDSNGNYDPANGTMKNENSNRALIYAGFGGNMNVYGGYFLYNNTPNDTKDRNNGAFNAKDFYSEEEAAEKGPLLTIHDGVYMINKEYRQNPANTSQPHGDYDNFSVVLAKYCEVVENVSHSVTIDGKTYNTWCRVTSMQPISLTVDGLQDSYAVGDTISGLTVTANYKGGVTKTLTEGEYTMSDVDMSTVGAKLITFTYTEEEKTVTLDLQTRTVAVTGIYAEAKAVKFATGSTVSKDNFKVYTTANDGSVVAISNFQVTGLNSSIAGTQTATITYGDYTTTFNITFVKLPDESLILDSSSINPNSLFNAVGFWTGSSSWLAYPHGDAAKNYSYTGTLGETYTDFYTGKAMADGVVPNLTSGYQGLTVNNAQKGTWVGVVTNIGFNKKIVEAGYYFDNDWLTYENHTVNGGSVTQHWESDANAAAAQIYWVQLVAKTDLSDFELNDTKQHTVNWVVKFEDGTFVTFAQHKFTMAQVSGEMYEETDKPNANVIILAGQSNATGHAPLTQSIKDKVAVTDFSNIYMHYKTSDGTDFTHAKQSNVGFDQYVPGMGAWVNPDATEAEYFGPELGLAQYIVNSTAMNGERWYIIKYSVCGSGLASDWLANKNYAQDMLDFVDEAVSELSKTYDVKISGLLWMQGETDAMGGYAANQYATNEQSFVTMVRNKFAKYATRVGSEAGSGITFIDMQIAPDNDIRYWTYAETVNTAKYNNCTNWVSGYYGMAGSLVPGAGWGVNANGKIPNSIYVETVDYTYKVETPSEHGEYAVIGDTADDCHYSAASMFGMGLDKFGIALEYMLNSGTVSTPSAPDASKFTVTYDIADGNDITSVTATQGEKITLITPTRDGYKFLGWSDGTNTYAAGAEYTVTGNITLTAQWESATPVAHTITVVNNAGVTVKNMPSEAYAGDTISFTLQLSSGYSSTNITVTGSDGQTKTVSVSRWSATTVELTMPAGDFTITISK